MEVSEISRGIVRIERDGRTYLGIDTGISGKAFTVSRFSDTRQARGWVVRGDILEFWTLNGFLEHHGTVYLYGPYREGVSLSDLMERQEDGILSLLLGAADALSLLERRSIPMRYFHADGILFLTGGGILILPPDLLMLVKDHQPLHRRIHSFERYNHPDLRDGRNALFALGVLAYRAVVGALPFPQEDEDELHERMRELDILPPLYRDPSIRPDVSDAVMSALRPTGEAGEITRFRNAVASWLQEGVRRPIDNDEAARIRDRGMSLERKLRETNRRRIFLRRYGRGLVITGVFLAAAVWLVAGILSNVFAPRAIEGFPPEEVIRTFYTSMNTLDHMTMEDCVIGGAGKDLIGEVTNLYVLSRVRYSVEGTLGFVDARQWIDEGRPELPADRNVYGIAGIEIRLDDTDPPDDPENEERLVFLADYEKWMPALSGSGQDIGSVPGGGSEPPPESTGADGEGGPASMISVGFARTDRLFLTTDRGDWVIYRIDRLREEPIPYPTEPR